MDSLQFVLELNDAMSDPANKQAAAAVKLAEALGQADAASKSLASRLAASANVSESTAKKAINASIKAATQEEAAQKKIAKARADNDARISAKGSALMSAGLDFITKSALAAAAALGAVAVASTVFALSQADQKRNLQLTLEAMLGSEQAGVQMEEQLNALAKTLPVTRERIDSLAVSLINAGQTGDTLMRTIKALATVEATAGAEGAGKLENLIEKWNTLGKVEPINAKQLAGTGITIDALNSLIAQKMGTTVANVEALMKAGKVKVSTGVDALNEIIEKRLGGVASKKLSLLSVQFEKAKENLGNLFEDSLGAGGIERFSAAIMDVLGLLDDSTQSGMSLKFLLGEIFTPLGEAMTGILPLVKVLIIQLEIEALRMYIFLKPAIKAIRELLGEVDEETTIEFVRTLGQVVFYTAAALTLAVGAVVAVGAAIAGAFIIPIQDGILALVGFYDSVVSVWDSIKGLDVFQIGSDLITGFVNGIEDSASKVWDSMSDLGKKALESMGISLDAHSPSRKAMALGMFTGEGFAMGLDASNDNADAAATRMVQLPAAAPAGGGRGGVTFNIENHFGPGTTQADAEAIGDAVLEKIKAAYESIGIQMGAPVIEESTAA